MKHLAILFLLMIFGIGSSHAGSMHIYKGNSSYSSDILYTWDGRYLYRGNSTYSSDIVFTWDGRYL